MTQDEARVIDVFFYGLFMDDSLLRAKGVKPRNPRRAAVEKFSLMIGNRASLVPSPHSVVHGMLFSLTHTEIETLYQEESVRMYRPEAVIARLNDGSIVPALCFNLPQPPAPDEKNPGYAIRLRALAERLELPAEYVSSIA